MADNIWKNALFSLLGVIAGTILAYLLMSPGFTRMEKAVYDTTYEVVKLEERIGSVQEELQRIETHLDYDDSRIDGLETKVPDPPPKGHKHRDENALTR